MSGPFYDEGFYQGKVTQQAMTKAGTGTPQFVLRFKVLEHSNGAPVPQQYERSWYRAITEKTMPYFEKDLATLGFQGASLRELDPNNGGNWHSFEGQTFEFRCTHESDQKGDPREKWQLALPMNSTSSGIEGAAMDSASYRQLDVLFNRNRKPAPTTRQEQVDQRAAELIDDNDIPF